MKHIPITFLLLLIGPMLFAQDIQEINQERLAITKSGMLVLGTWASANLLAGPILASRHEGSTKYFYQMNAYWNVVNLLLAGVGYYGAKIEPASANSLSYAIASQHKIEKLLLFNAGLDIAYIMGGLYMIERSKRINTNNQRLKGFGQSIIMQGAWLFVFDVGFYMVQSQYGSKLLGMLSTVNLNPAGFLIGIRL